MTIHFRRARQHLEAFDFERLFAEELGWGRSNGHPTSMTVDDAVYRLTPIAELGGMLVFTCEAQATAEVPLVSLQKKIDQQVSKLAYEHITIFVDRPRSHATWLWVKRVPGEPLRPRGHSYDKGQPGDSLLQKLSGIAFQIADLDEEGKISITKVAEAVKKSFDVERVTKRFYDEFKTEHDAFMKLLAGLDESTERAWYTSVMLNRLMFIYFIQKKNFLDGDPDYLRNRLKAMTPMPHGDAVHAGESPRPRTGKRDRFYRDFLVKLFFEGFAQEEQERSPETRKLLGKVPYLNGGLFQPHQLEQAHGKHLDIPDKVFERLFNFFDEYTWHLDDRPMHADNEINPDVLGYVFEKYINQKQMGAYYTKEDITGYICRNTILPFLFDKLVRERYGKLDRLPMDDVEPYIYPAVKQKELLPTETEREYAARQKRLAQIRADFQAGKIASINDLITYNLDIERFMQDWLRGLKDPASVQTFYFECLSKLTVLDPTVGSGAFLFAAMNILESLYELALDRMEALTGPKYPKFKEELARVALHTNRRHFVYKSIIINNLFGVDIMEEATEICKLRLFLKLVAQVDDVNRIEPLPDIDFNIRAGNTLVGYASLDEVEQAATRSLFSMNLPQKIKEADIALRSFRALQTQQNISAHMLTKAKADARVQLTEIEKTLNESLAAEYGARSLAKFVESHKPFHWYVEFNHIIQDGGFDVVVGNPPYVETRSVTDYRLTSFKTIETKNLYAIVLERCSQIGKKSGWEGFIVPVSSVSTDGYATLQEILKSRSLYYSSFDDRPSHLFDGLDKNTLSILLTFDEDKPTYYATRLHRWNARERDTLFERIYYSRPQYLGRFEHSMPKVSSPLEVSILRKIWANLSLAELIDEDGDFDVFYSRKINSFIQVLDFVPRVLDGRGRLRPPSEFKTVSFISAIDSQVCMCALNSTLFRWFLDVYTDGSHLNKREVFGFPMELGAVDSELKPSWRKLSEALSRNLQSTSETRTMKYTHDQLTVQCIFPKHSKSIIDDIDRLLAKHYGFTDEELDFIINYDIKYRMGRESESLIE